ncbi:MAG TPA: GNAT family N-acetyltransferase [Oligoflexus sp.]|uniref:GNAT family N-acetyltransferase n=1 Tax=Oligoflexus sp. TaxID=1971216 RepID=UPI002D7F3A05|nr:GNAT family N-acetyltransferase [Oligoflexus sp.]HET9238008.1 GNAT family N-acetyltransferase [Oligoflexus sp.]
MKSIQYETLHGNAAEAYIEDLARLRIQVFREFPYLYDGTTAYEARYLQTYFQCPDSLIVLARDADRIVGCATAIPLKFEEDEFKQPFLAQKMQPDAVMYFGESVLLPEYRGLGVGKTFLHKRISYAQSYPGIQWAAFCAVRRASDDPRRPSPYRPLDTLWQSFGFHAAPGMRTSYRWKEIGQSKETDQDMQFWLRPIP